MKTRTFQSYEISEIGLGCWQIGGDWGEVGDETALEILRAARQSGVTFLDTAAGYGSGRSERLIGRFLKEIDEPMFVATKVGRMADGHSDPREHLRASAMASRERLGVDALDLLQLHCWPQAHLDLPATWEALRELREEGALRHFGASVETCEEARFCLEQAGLASLQIIFNVFRQAPRDDIFETAKARGVALIVRLPLASGLLSGKFTPETSFGPGDHRNYNRDGAAFNVGETFAGLPFGKGVELAEEVRELLPGEIEMSAAALRWVLDHDAVTTIIPGASRPDQAVSNGRAGDIPPLPAETHERLASFYEQRVAPHIRGKS